MKFLRKIIFWILIASAIFAGGYFFIHYYNPTLNILEFYHNYQTYLIFLYISIILIYVCTITHSRVTTTIMVWLLLINFFWLASFFTQNILGIPTSEFYALTILFLVALAITHIKHRIRYPLIILTIIPFVIILLNHALPLYQESPDFQGFYASQDTSLIIQSRDNAQTIQDTESKITIKTDTTERIVDLLLTSQAIPLGKETTQIIFSSKTGLQNTFAYITFPQGTIITLHPQSAATLSQSTTTLSESAIRDPRSATLNILQGKINIYTPPEQSGYLLLTWDLTQTTLDDTGNMQYMIDDFLRRRNEYFINQIGGEIMLNASVDAFIGRYISLANSSIKTLENIIAMIPFTIIRSPFTLSSFDQNKLNYDTFHTYVDYKKSASFTAPEGSTQRITRDTQKGRNESNVKARRDIIKNTFNSRFGKE